jgi:hypothetical protein
MLKRHTPSLESVWDEWEREKRAAKRRAARPQRPDRPRTPDNSEPWLKHPPRSISDLFYISDKVAEVVEKWGPRAKRS